jgi:MFS family permease
MSAISHAVEAPSERLSLGAICVLTLGALDFGLEQSIIIPALPKLALDYHASLIAVTWLSTAFLLASIVAVPLCGRLGDLFGKRRLLLFSLGALTVGSLLCAITHSIAVAIAGRGIQGLGAAVAPLTLGLARDSVPAAQLPRMIGAVIGAANLGGGIGFLLSGVIVDAFSASAIFWFLTIVGGVLFLSVLAFVRESPVRARVRLDPIGAGLLSLGLASLLLAISKGPTWHWTSAAVDSLFVVAAIGLCSFAAFERRVREPVVDLRLVAMRPFANTNLCAFAFGFAFFIGTFLVPQIAASPKASGYGLALSTTHIGLLLVPFSVAGMATSWLGGRVVGGLGSRVVVAIGAALGEVGYLSLIAAHSSALALAAGSAVVGLGLGLILTGLYAIVLRRAPIDKTAVAAAVTVTFRNTAVSLGVTLAVVIVTSAGLNEHFVAESGFTRAFWLAAGGAAVAFIAALFLPGREPSRPT